MAEIQIFIKDDVAAKQWQARVDQLNQECKYALEQTGKTLEEIEKDADGTLVDELVAVGSAVVTGATHVFEGMNSLFNMVGSLLEHVDSFIDMGVDIIRKHRG